MSENKQDRPVDRLPDFVSLTPFEGDEWVRLEDSIGEAHVVVDVLTYFISSIASMRTQIAPMLARLEEELVTAKVNYDQLANEFRSRRLVSRQQHVPRHDMPPSKQTRYLRSRKALDDASYARTNVPNFVLLGLVSQYDAFVGSLVRALFKLKPDLVKSIERTLSIEDLETVGDLEGAYRFLIEKEIETGLRDNHMGQFSWLEKRFGVSTLRRFDELPEFLELIERRNLIAHNAGIVSNRYLQVCADAGYRLPEDLRPGATLGADAAYLERAHSILYTVGIRLAHVLWRKVRPDELLKADKVLTRTCYSLLVFEEWQLAQTLLRFAVDLPRHSNDHEKRIFIINLAHSYKWSGDMDTCEKILAANDWTATDDAFALATHVLRDQFDEAARYMKIVAQHEDVPEAGFVDWPLFRIFRRSPQFAPTFQEVFGHPYVP